MSPYFGFTDSRAETIDRLMVDFYEPPEFLYDDLKIGSKDHGACIIVAPKGAGKTAVRRVIEKRATDRGDLVWTIDQEYARDISKPSRGANRIYREISGLLLSGISAKLLNTAKDTKTQAAKWAKDLVYLLKKVGTAMDINIGGLQVDMEALFRSERSKFEDLRINQYQERLSVALDQRRCYILIDDIDDIFQVSYPSQEGTSAPQGVYEYPCIAEGIFRSVVNINTKFREALHVLVFVKAGVYEAYLGQAKAYNEIRDFVTVMTWTEYDLIRLFSRRLRRLHEQRLRGRQESSDDMPESLLWEQDFDINEMPLSELQGFIASRCNYGPRDMIIFCNDAKKLAGRNERIRRKDMEDVEYQYGKEKFMYLGQDFGQVYKGIEELLKMVFAEQRAVYSKEEIEKFIRSEIILNAEFADRHPFKTYIKWRKPEDIIKILYEVGFIGFDGEGDESYHYSMTHPYTKVALRKAKSYKIHEAYWAFLSIRPAVPTPRPTPLAPRPTSPASGP